MKTQIPDFEVVLKEVQGRNGLRAGKPPKASGFAKYVWRMSRFNSGIDVTMPITCDWDLQDYVEKFLGKKPQVIRYLDETYSKYEVVPEYEPWKKEYDEVRKIADEYADKVCESLGYSKYKAALIWGKAMGMVR